MAGPKDIWTFDIMKIRTMAKKPVDDKKDERVETDNIDEIQNGSQITIELEKPPERDEHKEG